MLDVCPDVADLVSQIGRQDTGASHGLSVLPERRMREGSRVHVYRALLTSNPRTTQRAGDALVIFAPNVQPGVYL